MSTRSGRTESRFQSTGSVWSPTEAIFRPSPPKTEFQSTGSVWSPTVNAALDGRTFENFNPRAPCGARPEAEKPKPQKEIFQSTGSVWSPTAELNETAVAENISIHGLRVEPDA